MDPIEQAKNLATEILEMLEEEVVNWPGLRDKLKEMRNKVGEVQPAQVCYLYGPVTYANPSDSAIDQMLSGEVVQFSQWVIDIP